MSSGAGREPVAKPPVPREAHRPNGHLNQQPGVVS